MITEDYVSFEVAKLLKEKGFDSEEVGCRDGFYSETAYESGHSIVTERGKEVGLVYDDLLNSELGHDEYLRPTLQMAMKWLREEHHLYVWISYNFNHTGLPWYYEIFDIKNRKVVKIGGVECGSYEKTCEIAIEECLKNLI